MFVFSGETFFNLLLLFIYVIVGQLGCLYSGILNSLITIPFEGKQSCQVLLIRFSYPYLGVSVLYVSGMWSVVSFRAFRTLYST